MSLVRKCKAWVEAHLELVCLIFIVLVSLLCGLAMSGRMMV